MNKVQSIVFGGLISAIHIVILILTMYLPDLFIDVVLMFLTPFLMGMYTVKCGIKHSLIVGAATLVISILIDVTQLRALLFVLPTLILGIGYGALVKYKATSHTIVYALAILELGIFFMSAGIINLLTGTDFIHNLKEIFRLHDSVDSSIFAFILLIAYCFAQAFLLHFILKFQLKRMKVTFSKSNYPPFWLFVLAIVGFVATFIPYSDHDVYVLITLIAVIFATPIAFYGYQKSAKKMNIMFFTQAAIFLVVSVPLIASKVCANYEAIPYIILFVPPFAYGVYDLFAYTYSGNTKFED